MIKGDKMFGGAMKSLIKSGTRELKAKFSKSDEDDDFPTPLGLRIGAVVDIGGSSSPVERRIFVPE